MKETFLIKAKAISVNQAYPTGKHGRRFLSPKGKEFKKIVADTLLYEYNEKLEKIKSETGKEKYCVEIVFCFKDKRRRDVDDYFKLLIDSLTDVVWKDDSQIVKLCGYKILDDVKNIIYISIEKL